MIGVTLATLVAAFALLGRAEKRELIDKAWPRGEIEVPRATKGAEDVAETAVTDKVRKQVARVEVRFPSPLDAGKARALLAESEAKGKDPLYQAALACAAKPVAGDVAGLSGAFCYSTTSGGCMYWCCEDPASGRKACRMVWCDAKPASPKKD